MKHSPEPWDLEEIPYETNDPAGGWYLHTDRTGVLGEEPLYISMSDMSEANAKRICQCVNACAGIEDPAATIKEMAAVLRDFANVYDPTGCEQCGVVDEFVHTRAQDILAKLKGETK